MDFCRPRPKKRNSFDIADAEVDVCFDTGGTDHCKDEPAFLGKSNRLNPEDQKRHSEWEPLLSSVNVLHDLSPVLVQRLAKHMYVVTLPIC